MAATYFKVRSKERGVLVCGIFRSPSQVFEAKSEAEKTLCDNYVANGMLLSSNERSFMAYESKLKGYTEQAASVTNKSNEESKKSDGGNSEDEDDDNDTD